MSRDLEVGGLPAKSAYDVVVVGAGIAGLTAANYLARAGRSVLVLEHNHQVGGLMSGIWRKGFYFDCGTQGFESMGISNLILKELGLYSPVDWEPSVYRLSTPTFSVRLTSFEEIARAMAAAHPDDADGIEAYFREMKSVAKMVGAACEDGAVPLAQGRWTEEVVAWWTIAKRFLLNGRIIEFLRVASPPHPEMVARHIEHPQIRRMLSSLGYQNWSVGASAMFWLMWMDHYVYPRHGLQPFLNGLQRHSESNGCDYLLNRTVTRVFTEGGRASGVQTHKGEIFAARQVVFCGDVRRLYNEILREAALDPQYARSTAAAALSDPMTSAYLGVAMSTEELGERLDCRHVIHYPTFDLVSLFDHESPQMHTSNMVELTWTSMTNPALAPAGHSALVLQSLSNYRWNDYWKTRGKAFASPAEYRALKREVLADMVGVAEQIIPGLGERIVYSDLGTPQSATHFTLNSEGATCSWSWDPAKYHQLIPRFRTPVDGLHTAGHWAMWPGGIPLAMLSGKLVAKGIMNGFFSPPVDSLVRRSRGLIREIGRHLAG